jgi:hypothetical protein
VDPPDPAIGRTIAAKGMSGLSSVLKESDQPDRSEHLEDRTGSVTKRIQEEGFEMKKFGFAAIAAAGITGALVGLAAPASATTVAAPAAVTSVDVANGIDHHQWLDDIRQQVKTPPAPIVGNGR